MQWYGYIQLIRPANIVTAIADIIAGVAITGLFTLDVWNQEVILNLCLLILSTSCLYGGGIVFNDVFDIEQDKIHRPERVIPSGRVSLNQAKRFGTLLFLVGILAAFGASILSGGLATVIALLAFLYDKYSKHNLVLGPLNMGACRGSNLLLGMSIVQPIPSQFLWIGLLPIIFVAAITLTAQKESQGKNKRAIMVAMVLDATIVAGILLLGRYFNFSLKSASIFIVFWYGVNFLAKLKAIRHNHPIAIKNAVKTGVLSLIPLNASYVAGFGSMYLGLATLCLLPLSIYLAKRFAVT
ncbi:UbiA-like protein EboC [Flagellimonas algicola]|uniref:Polyprenyltransferase n=1 Tax=Flagellimonas algicola TaxID=2583815 RepID=A0ABY2WNG4_9FLAO|nr:UbiA-like protein EboC [Allomuricauda algicola]TMU56537.1 polyprenyltransferase [Allomuricauda algicola]